MESPHRQTNECCSFYGEIHSHLFLFAPLFHHNPSSSWFRKTINNSRLCTFVSSGVCMQQAFMCFCIGLWYRNEWNRKNILQLKWCCWYHLIMNRNNDESFVKIVKLLSFLLSSFDLNLESKVTLSNIVTIRTSIIWNTQFPSPCGSHIKLASQSCFSLRKKRR